MRKKIGSQYNEKKLSEVAQRIKARRIALGYSYQDLADLTSMSKSTLQRYETGGIANLPVDKIDCIAIALKTTSEYLMGWKNAVAQLLFVCRGRAKKSVRTDETMHR